LFKTDKINVIYEKYNFSSPNNTCPVDVEDETGEITAPAGGQFKEEPRARPRSPPAFLLNDFLFAT
jgi:hypothetical protein